MPLAPDVFLQANVAAPARSSAVSNSFKPAETSKADASSFSDVYAQQSREKPAVERDVPTKSVSDKSAPDRDKVAAVKDKPAAVGKDKPDSAAQTQSESDQVAESGNSLPVQAKSETASPAEQQDTDPAAAAEQLAALASAIELPVAEVPVDAPAAPEADADAEVVVVTDSVEQSQLAALSMAAPAQAVVQTPVTPEVSPETATPSMATVSATPSAASVAAMPAAYPAAAATVANPLAADDEAFDPETDPLDGLHALQFALESASGRSRPSTQPAVGQERQAPVNPEADDVRAQNVVNNLAMPVDDSASQDDSTESSDRSFTAVLGDGLKDVKSAAGDTRVDNFAERLAALSQAAQPARPVTAPAQPVASPLSQPLSMHQSGWTEGIVDRVMYLSSQNLKSAEIKLEPAELGRLDIRVNMAPDQQTQVTFSSAHLGVRDALESQVARLRESFNQQGLGQVDVNVSDQSQQQAQQQAQDQANRAQRSGRGARAEADGEDESAPAAAVAVSQPVQRVVGSSEIDFYA